MKGGAHHARQAVPLPGGVECHAVAGSVARRAGELKERVIGDGLVPLESALGLHAGLGRTPLFPASRQVIAQGVSHLGLLSSKKVYRALRKALGI